MPNTERTRSETIASRMARGRSSGFDYIRIFLAAAVIFAHSPGVIFGKPPMPPASSWPPLTQPLYWAIVPCFFALSGFLVAGSLERSKTTLEFVLLRVLRIVPALFVETVLAALVLGPIVTAYPLGAYFTAHAFWHYPLNIVGDIHYELPGVFLHNPWPRIVNAQLWTIPAELLCYLALTVLAVLGVARIRYSIPILTVATLAALLFAQYAVPIHVPPLWKSGGFHFDSVGLVVTFLAGVSLFALRDRLPLNGWLFAASLLFSYVLLYGGALQYLAAFPIAYATIYVGLTDFPKTIVTATGDYSYGVYLYGFPIQQLLAWLFPQNREPLLNFAGALMIALVLAVLSWRFVESQILERRGVIIAAVQRFGRRRSATANA